MESPFTFQGPLPPEEVRGRDGLVGDLVERITARRVTALLGPRRFGKTSTLRRLAADLDEVALVWVDLYGVQSLADVAVRFDKALTDAPTPFAAEARPVAATVQVNLGVVRTEFSRPRREQPDPAARLSQLLDVFVGAAFRCPCLLVIDEFSDIGEAPGAAKMLRTALQHHYRQFGVVFAGSQVSTMRELFSGREQPFYGQAELVEIGPLDAATVDVIVQDGFTSAGRDPGRVAALIHDLAGGHPQRTMLLADAAWRHTPPGAAGHDRWGDALEEVRAGLDGGMRTIYDGLTSGEQRVLRLVANGQPLYGAAAHQLNLTAGSATHARRQLVRQGHLHEDGKRLVDPLFADWVRQTLS